jgi:hypothetical protein
MRATRILAFAAAPALLLLAGCDIASVLNAKTASEERRLTAAHVPKSALEVHTGVGAVEIVADSSLKDVQIIAKVTASGRTDDEAQARLEKIVVKADRRPDNVLEITARPAEDGQPLHGGCAFAIRVPDAAGITVQVGTGTVTLKGLSGAADIDTGTGAIAVADHQGNVAANTGTGAIHLANITGDVKANAATGAINLEKITGKVEAESGTGAIAHAPAQGSDSPFNLNTGIGSIAVELPNSAAGTIQATTTLGSIQIDGPRQPRSVTGGRTSKEITLGEKGPASTAQTGTGSITITLK